MTASKRRIEAPIHRDTEPSPAFLPSDCLRYARPPPISYLVLEYLVTPLVPSEIACLASSPGRMSRTAVWISREEMVDFLL